MERSAGTAGGPIVNPLLWRLGAAPVPICGADRVRTGVMGADVPRRRRLVAPEKESAGQPYKGKGEYHCIPRSGRGEYRVQAGAASG